MKCVAVAPLSNSRSRRAWIPKRDGLLMLRVTLWLKQQPYVTGFQFEVQFLSFLPSDFTKKASNESSMSSGIQEKSHYYATKSSLRFLFYLLYIDFYETFRNLRAMGRDQRHFLSNTIANLAVSSELLFVKFL